ncbi:YqiA/YcfP family alpha/beta fold hydrolase [Scytonema sp. NUACC26]|uniref:YqiA/YcfP family alpha/beta fold hydrolase n=1 Tax=Scytonema sp. NUACC26 TaxID=3140176 RepID=UPI0034DC79CF
MQYIYLHGFASSPCSAKAVYLHDCFTQVHIKLKIPDLNAGDFTNLSISRQLSQISLEFPDPSTSVTLIGSSLGGLTAAHLGQQHQQVKCLVLLAPAFGFLYHWLPKLGDEALQQWQQEKYLMVHHYGEKRSLPLSYNFVSDAYQYKEEVLQRPTPTLILHGKHDEVIPIQASRHFALQRPWVKLLELDSDHSLSNVMPEIWQAIQQFCLLTAHN